MSDAVVSSSEYLKALLIAYQYAEKVYSQSVAEVVNAEIRRDDAKRAKDDAFARLESARGQFGNYQSESGKHDLRFSEHVTTHGGSNGDGTEKLVVTRQSKPPPFLSLTPTRAASEKFQHPRSPGEASLPGLRRSSSGDENMFRTPQYSKPRYSYSANKQVSRSPFIKKWEEKNASVKGSSFDRKIQSPAPGTMYRPRRSSITSSTGFQAQKWNDPKKEIPKSVSERFSEAPNNEAMHAPEEPVTQPAPGDNKKVYNHTEEEGPEGGNKIPDVAKESPENDVNVIHNKSSNDKGVSRKSKIFEKLAKTNLISKFEKKFQRSSSLESEADNKSSPEMTDKVTGDISVPAVSEKVAIDLNPKKEKQAIEPETLDEQRKPLTQDEKTSAPKSSASFLELKAQDKSEPVAQVQSRGSMNTLSKQEDEKHEPIDGPIPDSKKSDIDETRDIKPDCVPSLQLPAENKAIITDKAAAASSSSSSTKTTPDTDEPASASVRMSIAERIKQAKERDQKSRSESKRQPWLKDVRERKNAPKSFVAEAVTSAISDKTEKETKENISNSPIVGETEAGKETSNSTATAAPSPSSQPANDKEPDVANKELTNNEQTKEKPKNAKESTENKEQTTEKSDEAERVKTENEETKKQELQTPSAVTPTPAEEVKKQEPQLPPAGIPTPVLSAVLESVRASPQVPNRSLSVHSESSASTIPVSNVSELLLNNTEGSLRSIGTATMRRRKVQKQQLEKLDTATSVFELCKGRSREWINENLECDKMGLVKGFVMASFGIRTNEKTKKVRVYTIVLNDEYNELALSTEDIQTFYIGKNSNSNKSKPTLRDRAAEALVAPPQKEAVALFFAPKRTLGSDDIYYCGHWQVSDGKKLSPPRSVKGQMRQALAKFTFAGVDRRIITAMNQDAPDAETAPLEIMMQ